MVLLSGPHDLRAELFAEAPPLLIISIFLEKWVELPGFKFKQGGGA